MANELTVAQAAEKRRSTKAFKPDPIPEEILQKVIDITRSAPSSFNLQPTRIVLIKDQKQKEALAAVAWGQKQILQAPVVLVFTVAIRGWEKTIDKIVDDAVRSGGWPEATGEYIRKNAPGFQNGLGDKQREYAIKDAIIAASFASLAAESLGLGSCFMNGWDEAGVKKVIGVEGDPDVAVALVLPIGYHEAIYKNPGRLPQSETFFIDRLK